MNAAPVNNFQVLQGQQKVPKNCFEGCDNRQKGGSEEHVISKCGNDPAD